MAWSTSPQGGADFVSKQITDVHGRDESSVLGENWVSVLHPDDRDRAARRWHEAVTTGEPYETTFRVAMPDGYRWQLVRGRAVRNDAGEITRWVGVNTDIDDQHRADEARETFVALAENSSDFIGICDLDGNVTYVNEAGRTLLAIGSVAQACRTPLLNFFFPTTSRTRSDKSFQPYEKKAAGSATYACEISRRTLPLPVSYNAFALCDRAGKVVAFATIVHDLRGRLAVQSGLLLLSRIGAAIASLDLGEILRNVARAFVPEFASYCVVDVVTDDLWQRTAIYRDATKSSLLQELSRPSGDHPTARAIANGQTTLAIVGADRLANVAPDRAKIAHEIDTKSFACVPIVTRGALRSVPYRAAAMANTAARI